jgi:16S rRNA (guanine1516-N2)-methyltransferase
MKENLSDELRINFLSGKLRYRSEHAGLRNELIARAIGMRPQEHPKIVDATAGLGRDSYILASVGFDVIMLERSPIIHELLNDALLRAKDVLPDIIGRMHLIQADAIDWLKNLPEQERPDVIYLDPMFPTRKKSASVKKEMVIMQELLGKDIDYVLLFETAMACATKRVVVKRPRLASNIIENAAKFSLNGKSSRFDIYLVKD